MYATGGAQWVEGAFFYPLPKVEDSAQSSIAFFYCVPMLEDSSNLFQLFQLNGRKKVEDSRHFHVAHAHARVIQ